MATYTIAKPAEAWGDAEGYSPTGVQLVRDFYELALVYFVALFDFLSVLLGAFAKYPTPPLANLRSEALARFLSRPWPLMGGTASAEPFEAFHPLLATLKGTILEIGPGSGQMLQFYSAGQVHALCTAEPCNGIYPALLASAERAGLMEKFTSLQCGAERATLEPALRQAGMLAAHHGGIFDAIVCSKVLCAVPNPQDTVDFLYHLLKPGGRLVLREHVRNESSGMAKWTQTVFMWMRWSFLVGGCNLDRDTVRMAEAAAELDGGWAENRLVCMANWACVPFVVGELVKK